MTPRIIRQHGDDLQFNCADSFCSSELDDALTVPKWMYALVAFGTAGGEQPLPYRFNG